MSQAKENDKVKVHYTGKLKDGQVFDSSLEREPLEVTIGQGMLIPGFENAIIGMEPNEKKTIEISKDEAYGDVQKELFHEVKKEQLPPDMKPEVGMRLSSRSNDGQEHSFTVTEVKEDSIIVDGNHPLAGRDLIFEVELLEIA